MKETAENLGIHPGQINTWKRELSAHSEQAFPGNGRLKADDEEIRKLRLELKRTREERDILKKATKDSTGGRNRGIQYNSRGFEVQGFSGPLVEPAGYLV